MSVADEATVVRCPSCGKRNRVRQVASGVPQCANCHRPLPWIVNTDERGFGSETTASVPVVVDFWAPWCGPCRMISPALERLADRYAGRIKVVKVNVDENPDLARRFQAMSIPLLVLIEQGKETDRKVGALPEAQLRTWLEPRLPADRQQTAAGGG